MKFAIAQQLLTSWLERCQQQHYFNIPDAQMYQMLGYIQEDVDLLEHLHHVFPKFIDDLRYIDLKGVFWNPEVTIRYKPLLEKLSFYAFLPPNYTGALSPEYVKNYPNSFDIDPEGTLDILLQHSIDLEYTPSINMQLAWFQRDQHHYFTKYLSKHINQKLIDRQYNTEQNKWLQYQTMYEHTGHPIFMALMQKATLGGNDRDTKAHMLAFMAQNKIKPWSKNDAVNFITQHIDIVMDYLTTLFIAQRPRTQDYRERREWLWEICKNTSTDPIRLVTLADRFYDLNPYQSNFTGSILQHKEKIFQELLKDEIIPYSDFEAFLLDKPLSVAIDYHEHELFLN